MQLTEALNQIQETKRSKTFIFACKASEINTKLSWMAKYHGNKTIAELVEERE